jgi:hypothetical protein
LTAGLPDNFDPELVERFVCPVLDLVRSELDRGTDQFQIAIFLTVLASAVAHKDPVTEHDLLTLLAAGIQAAADELCS